MHDIPENLTSETPQTDTGKTAQNGPAFDLRALARALPAGPTLAAFAAVALRRAYGLPIAAAARSTGANTTYTRAAERLSPEEIPAYVCGKKKLFQAHRRHHDLDELLQQTMQTRRDPASMTDEEHLARIGRERVQAWLDRFPALEGTQSSNADEENLPSAEEMLDREQQKFAARQTNGVADD